MEYIALMDYSVHDGISMKQRTTSTEPVGQFEHLRVLLCVKSGTARLEVDFYIGV